MIAYENLHHFEGEGSNFDFHAKKVSVSHFYGKQQAPTFDSRGTK